MATTVKKEKIAYVESADFFPKEIRKKYGIGEYAKSGTAKSGTASKKTANSKSTAKKSK